LGIKIEGKSLFNNGIDIVVSDILLKATETGKQSTAEIGTEIGTLFREEALGGLLFGFVIFNSMCLIS
jgi:CPA1 family monovalent cation:H+ antiporter